jgi:hypothetical protein
VFADACRLGDEGIVSKKIDAAVGAMLRLDQGSQSRQHHSAAGTERDLEQVINRGRLPLSASSTGKSRL